VLSNTSSTLSDYDGYLKPCNSCTPTESDFENLTTFELFAKYPSLDDDTYNNSTTTNQADDSIGESSSMFALPENQSSTEDNARSENSTINESNQNTAPEASLGDNNNPDNSNSTQHNEENEPPSSIVNDTQQSQNDIEQQNDNNRNCDSAYPEVCIPSPPPDLDCRDISEKKFEWYCQKACIY
jgi:hypothetical protein